MFELISADYTHKGDDWKVTVSGKDKTLTASAEGLIAARDRVDQLVEELAPGEHPRTVVHMIEGDAVGFTAAYLTARLARPAPEAPTPTAPQKAEAREPAGVAEATAKRTTEPAPKPAEATEAAGKTAEAQEPEKATPSA
ncbi:hypothetical protein [Actinokineospora iranica]|uniref:Uncharacterized protein n=1 Tax=Actinokineospora iranica TaxID=1271860 RepID=A0A1G6X4R0_9PSEU|nr:hypothetical protein [Actinokineospora iranica]SDD73132.1 hypothetical protein SAMN05216174_116106 [Actinokineospora iranica]